MDNVSPDPQSLVYHGHTISCDVCVGRLRSAGVGKVGIAPSLGLSGVQSSVYTYMYIIVTMCT
jgi:hypothetical protein